MTYYLQTQSYQTPYTNTYFGGSMSFKGNILAVSGNGTTKKVLFFDFINGLFVKQTAEITLTESVYSCCLSADGNTIAIGCPIAAVLENKVVIYDKVGASWVRRSITISPEVQIGYFGYSIALNADASLLVVGDWKSPTYQGGVHTFRIEGNTATELVLLTEPTGYVNACFGLTVALNPAGNLLAVGTPRKNDALTLVGNVSFFFFDGENWTTKSNRPPLYAPTPSSAYYFGSSLAFSDDMQTMLVADRYKIFRYTFQNGDFSWIADSVTINITNVEAGIAFVNLNENQYVLMGVPLLQGYFYLYKQVKRFVGGIVRQAGIGVIRTIYVTPPNSFVPFITKSSGADGTWIQQLDMTVDDPSMVDVLIKSNDMSKNNDVLYKVIPSREY